MQLLILLIVVIGAFAEDCPANSHYNECGTFCPITCENYKDPPQVCIRMCNDGCFCDEEEGYVLTKDERCVLPDQCEQSADTGSDVCELPLETGPCKGLFYRYGFDKVSGECKQFVYGGCSGNGNNFRTLGACESACKA